MFTDTTVTQYVVNDGCKKSSSGVRRGEVCAIGTGTGDTDATITRSTVDNEYQEIRSEVEDILIGAVDVVETRYISDCWKEMCNTDSLDKYRRKYCMEDANGFIQAFFKREVDSLEEEYHSSNRLIDQAEHSE